jgi:hypothetical protein
MAQPEYRQRSLDRAYRRFLSAVKTLALVRRLALGDIDPNEAGFLQDRKQRLGLNKEPPAASGFRDFIGGGGIERVCINGFIHDDDIPPIGR